MTRADRHVVVGSRGTAVMSGRAVAIVDARPASSTALAWEDLLFDASASPDPLDPLAELDPETITAFALVEATSTGTAVLRHGDAQVQINGRPWSNDDPTASTLVGPDDPVTIALEPTDDTPTGQWVTSGVVGASAVIVGRLNPPAPERATTVNPVIDVAPELAASDQDFGNLLASRGAPAAPPTEAVDATPPAPAPPTAPAPADLATSGTDTAAFVRTGAVAPDSQLRTGDGQALTVTTPIVIGRRPPDDPIAGQTPQIVTIDDALASRHHATVLVVDGRLVVVDQGSTNGTWVTPPGGEPRRCVPDQPVEVAPGAIIDVAGVFQAVHDTGHQ